MQVKWSGPLLSGCSHVWIKHLITLHRRCQLCELIVMVSSTFGIRTQACMDLYTEYNLTHQSQRTIVRDLFYPPESLRRHVIIFSACSEWKSFPFFQFFFFFQISFSCQRINYCSLLILSVGAEAVDKKVVRRKVAGSSQAPSSSIYERANVLLRERQHLEFFSSRQV